MQIKSSELIINADGSIFHLHVKPEQLADKVILVGDPGRVSLVASHFDEVECEVENREFRTVTGYYQGKRLTVVSTGIGCDNIDIVVNELDALVNIDFETRTVHKDLKKLSARKQGRVAERGRSGRERGILGSEPGGPSVTGWLRGATGAHIN